MWNPEPDEQPLWCLLENDELIYKIEVDTEYLLAEKHLEKNETMWIINVRVRGNRFDREYADLIV